MVRWVSFWLQSILMFGGLIAWICIDVLQYGNEQYLVIMVLCLVIAFIAVIDLEWSRAIRYQATNMPVKKVPIDWLESDSEKGW
jgi:hypothetical protein